MPADLDELAGILGRVPLFRSLPWEELRRLATLLRSLEAPPDCLLFREGEYGDYFYVLIEGRVEIIKALDSPDARLLSTRGAGEFIGEMSLFNPDGLRTASVRTQGPARLLEMRRADFDALLERQPKLAYEMVRVVSERMKASENDALSDLSNRNRQLQEAYENLKAAQAELVEKEKLERELELARQIQMSVLPAALPVVEGFEFGALMAPARAVGGDFYDFIPLGGGKLGVAVGDVTDKGIPAAILMAQTFALLHAEASRADSPAQALQRVNANLLEMNARGLFVTVLYGELEAEGRCFRYARAGHVPPICAGPNGGAALLRVGLGQPLGILEDPQLDQNAVQLPPGSLLLLYTDGATEESNLQGEYFGEARLRRALESAASRVAGDIPALIYRELENFKGSASLSDDVTLIAVRSLL